MVDRLLPSIAAVVVSLPERHHLLQQALDSIHAQTRPPDDILIGVDPRRYGEAGNMNRLIAATDCEWVAFLHDDDLWHTDHLATSEKFVEEGDVIVSRFDLEGRPWNTIEPWHDDFDDLRHTNWICSPSSVIVRKATFGEWCDPDWHRWVDWTNWNRLLDEGARFIDTRQVTVTNRFGDWGNGSWSA